MKISDNERKKREREREREGGRKKENIDITRQRKIVDAENEDYTSGLKESA